MTFVVGVLQAIVSGRSWETWTRHLYLERVLSLSFRRSSHVSRHFRSNGLTWWWRGGLNSESSPWKGDVLTSSTTPPKGEPDRLRQAKVMMKNIFSYYKLMAPQTGLEPMTTRLTDERSTELSYWGIYAGESLAKRPLLSHPHCVSLTPKTGLTTRLSK